MKSYPRPEVVLDDLGDKVVEAFGWSVARAHADLSEYRDLRPGWVAQASERGLATWIHDRMWYHLTVLLGGLSEVRLVDQEPTREIFVDERYRLRVKRHGEDGRVSTYQTQTAIEFLAQGFQQDVLDGLDQELNLIVGYVWDAEMREMGRPVLSLRNGIGIEWMHDLPESGTGYPAAPVAPVTPPRPGPPAPRIDLAESAQEAAQEAEGIREGDDR